MLRITANALVLGLCALMLPHDTVGQEPIQVLPAEYHADQMMQRWLMQKADERFEQWAKTFESLKTPEQIEAYQQERRQRFVESIGGFPEPTPLNPKITGTISRNNYRVEKILFESQPGLHVSSALFLPDDSQFSAPYPAVLVVCGHSSQAKAYEAYQTACALLAKNGVAALIIDPIGQGERYQHLNDDGSIALSSTTAGHSLLGLGSILLGQNTARFEIWDGMRAIDYLQSRDDIDGDRIGCMGNSGGGTQTAYLMALDDRIKAASPACYITSFERLLNTIGPQDAEQNIAGQLAWGMDHADYLLMRAPTPILICCASNDFFDISGTWDSFRKAKRLYSRLGYSERIELSETDNTHGWHQPLREAAVEWMVRWLAGRDIEVSETGIELIPESELWASPKGQVLLLEGARTGFELNQQTNETLAEARNEIWQNPDEAIRRVRELAGIRELDQLEPFRAESLGTSMRDDHSIERVILHPESGIALPAVLYRPFNVDKPQPWTIFLHENGKQGSDDTTTPEALVASGRPVLAVDIRGVGATKPNEAVWYDPRFGEDGKHLMIAYLLGYSYVGLRAEDIIGCARWAIDQDGINQHGVDLNAVGEVGTSALHAAAVESEIFRRVRLDRSLRSWNSIVTSPYSEDQLVNIVHGGLTAYDLTNLIEYLGDKIEMTNPE